MHKVSTHWGWWMIGGLVLAACVSPPTPAPTATALPPTVTLAPTFVPLPTESPTVSTPEMHWHTFTATVSNYVISYPLELYSLRSAPEVPGALAALYPGPMVLAPNDIFALQQPPINTYQIYMAARENPNGLTLDMPEALLTEGLFSRYGPEVLVGLPIEQVTLGGEKALRVNNLPVGQAGITRQIVALHRGRIYELVVMQRYVGAERDALVWVEQILATFKFVDE